MPEFPDCECLCVAKACACEKDCPYQDYLVDNGFAISCDECGFAGRPDSDSWIGVVDGQGMCSVFCSRKCAGEENYKIYEAAQKVVDSRSTR